MSKIKSRNFMYFVKRLTTVIGIVLVWRGVWYVLDWLDIVFWNGSHGWTALVGILLGIFILYIPDGELKEIEKL